MTDTIVEITVRTLRDFPLYTLEVGSYDKEDETSAPYRVVNKDTGVFEFQSFVLPAALEMAMKLQNAMTNITKELDEEDAKVRKASIKLVDKTNH